MNPRNRFGVFVSAAVLIAGSAHAMQFETFDRLDITDQAEFVATMVAATQTALTGAGQADQAAQIEQLFTLTDRMAIAFSPTGQMAWLCVHDAYNKPNKEDWLFTFVVCSRTDNGPDCSLVGDELATYWPTQPWPEHLARGRVTLLGDAVHPLVPQRAQGMNNAILDVMEFMKEIDKEERMTAVAIEAAIKRYETSVWERGAEIVAESLETGLMVTDWESLMKSPLMKFSMAYKAKTTAEAPVQPNRE